MEQQILKAAIQDKEAYVRLSELDADSYFSDAGKIIWKSVSEYYSKDAEAQECDIEIIKQRIIRTYPRQESVFENIFELLIAQGRVSTDNIVAEIISLAERDIGCRLASALIENSRDKDKLLNEYNELSNKFNDSGSSRGDVEIYNGVSVSDLFSESESVRKIKLLPMSLNERIGGGIEPGDNILIFARPEVGKSLIAINAACGFLVQGYKVLYYGNEDPAQRMVRRFVSRLSGMDKQSCMGDPQRAMDIALQRGYEKLFFVKGQSNTFTEIRNQLERIEPDILIIDQLRHMESKGNDNRVQQLENAAIEARAIASFYHIPVINVTQAGDSADGKLVLGQGDVDFSNTGIPGAMDLMVGVGANDEYLKRQMRRISLPKNKLNNDHSSFDIIVNEQLSKVVE